MGWFKSLVLLFCYYQWISSSELPCIIDLDCAECIPENMPLVTSHHAINGSITVPHGDEMLLWCGVGRLQAYPQRDVVVARCDSGRLLMPDHRIRPLLELGCQENVFEDVLHTVEHCAPPLQGRAYLVQEHGGSTRHLAALCYDADRAVATFILLAPPTLPPHSDTHSPLSLLGNFNHMFDLTTRHTAERLFSDDSRTNARLRHLFHHDKISFAGQTVTAGRLLSGLYFDDQYRRAATFTSNTVVAWYSVVHGNLAHLHHDVGKAIRVSQKRLTVYAGTHSVGTLRTGDSRSHIYLNLERFPVPKYLWTVVYDKRAKKAVAIVVLNDPFVSVSEIRDSVFCESDCSSVSWLHELHRHRNYETPLYGLTFCCEVHNFTSIVNEMPKQILAEVPQGREGLLTNLFK